MFFIALVLRGRSYTQGTIPLPNAALKLAQVAPVKRQVTEDPRNWLPTRHKRRWRVERGVAWEENWMSKKLGESEKLYIVRQMERQEKNKKRGMETKNGMK
jgi:hypothetical protein